MYVYKGEPDLADPDSDRLLKTRGVGPFGGTLCPCSVEEKSHDNFSHIRLEVPTAVRRRRGVFPRPSVDREGWTGTRVDGGCRVGVSRERTVLVTSRRERTVAVFTGRSGAVGEEEQTPDELGPTLSKGRVHFCNNHLFYLEPDYSTSLGTRRSPEAERS